MLSFTVKLGQVLKLIARTRPFPYSLTGHRSSSNDETAAGLCDSENTSLTLPNRNIGFEQLPPELVEAIFDYLRRNKRALKACSLVCKAWLHPAYRRLFYDARLNWNQLYSAFLYPRPKCIAAPFMRRLHLCIDSLSDWNYGFILFHGFHSITSLSFDTLCWDEIFLEVRRTFVDHQFNTITRLQLRTVITRSFSELAQLVCAFRCLENLILGETIWRISDNAPHSLHLPQHLHALEFDGSKFPRILEWLSSFGQALTLRNVCFLKPHKNHYQVINTFLRVLGPSLESFRVRLERINCPIRLDHNARLRFLHLDVRRGLPGETGLVSLFSGVTSELIEELSLRVFHVPDNHGNFDRCVTREWGDVDAILAGPQFSNLKTVSVHHTRFNHDRPHKEYPFEWMLVRLPNSHKRGMLRLRETKTRGPFI